MIITGFSGRSLIILFQNIDKGTEDMIELRRVEKNSEHIERLESINIEAIPECERNSLDDLIDTKAEVQGIFLNHSPVGYFVLREYKSILYLAYFAVNCELRSKGIGSKALARLIGEKKDHQIVVEFEAPPGSEPNDMSTRRRAFYLRNGFYETGWFTFYDDTEFEIACTSSSFDVYTFNEFTEYLSTLVSDHIPKPYRKD